MKQPWEWWALLVVVFISSFSERKVTEGSVYAAATAVIVAGRIRP